MASTSRALKNGPFSDVYGESGQTAESAERLSRHGLCHTLSLKLSARKDAWRALRYPNDPGLSFGRGQHICFFEFPADAPGRLLGRGSLHEDLHLLRAGEFGWLAAGFQRRQRLAASRVLEPHIETWKFGADSSGAKGAWSLRHRFMCHGRGRAYPRRAIRRRRGRG